MNLDLALLPTALDARAITDSWRHSPPPADAEVVGTSWSRDPLLPGVHETVVCFRPLHGDLRLSPLARVLRFSPPLAEVSALSSHLELLWHRPNFALMAFGQWLWTGTVTSAAPRHRPSANRPVLVLISDEPASTRDGRAPRIPLTQAWSALVPIRITGPGSA